MQPGDTVVDMRGGRGVVVEVHEHHIVVDLVVSRIPRRTRRVTRERAYITYVKPKAR